MNARTAFLAVVFLAAASAAGANSLTYTKSFPAAGRPSVHVNADDASVHVTSSSAAQVEFRVEYAGYTLGKNLRIEARQDSNQVELSTRTVGRVGISLNVKPRRVHIEVRMPKEGDLQIVTGDGAVEVSSIDGNVSVRTGDGSVDSASLSGTIDLHTGDGRIGADKIKGELRMRSGDGAIEGSDLDGRCDVITGDGRVRLAGRFDALNVASGDGGIGVRVAAGSKMSAAWSLRSGDGAIDLTLPAGFQARLDATTGDGKILLGVPVTVEGSMSEKRVRGTLNGGGAALNLHTGDGAIRLNGG